MRIGSGRRPASMRPRHKAAENAREAMNEGVKLHALQ